MGEKIRVLIVDDHALFRSGVKSLLQRHQEFEVVDVAGDGLEGVKRAKFLKPDVVLLDLNMPGVPGLDALRLIVEEVPEAHVLMLTVSEDAEDLMDALRAGASGYLLKNIETDPDWEFTNPSIHFTSQGKVIITYVASRMDDTSPPGRLGRSRMPLKMAMADLGWFYE